MKTWAHSLLSVSLVTACATPPVEPLAPAPQERPVPREIPVARGPHVREDALTLERMLDSPSPTGTSPVRPAWWLW